MRITEIMKQKKSDIKAVKNINKVKKGFIGKNVGLFFNRKL